VTQSAPVLAWPSIPHPLQRIRVIRTCAPGVVMSPQLPGRRGSSGAWPLTYRPVLPRQYVSAAVMPAKPGYITRLSHV